MEIYRSRSDVGKRDVGRGGILCGHCRVTRRRYEDPPLWLRTMSSRVLGSFLIVLRDICRPWSFNLRVVYEMEPIEDMEKNGV